MNWQHFQTYNEGATKAFEAMCNQLFELWINREYKNEKKSFVVVNGAGGDGGVEAYTKFLDGEEIGVQAKWFPSSINTSQFNQIKGSILTALEVHPKIVKYIVCVPRDLSNEKKGKDGKIVKETEYSKWNQIVVDIKSNYPNIDIIFWGEHELERQLQHSEAAGVRRYWFEKEELTKETIKYSFEKQKLGWMNQRYIPVLHNQGKIHKEVGSFLGNYDECLMFLKKLDTVENDYKLLLTRSKALYELLEEKNIFVEKMVELQELCNRISQQLVEVKKIKDEYKSENILSKWNDYVWGYEKIGLLEKWIADNSYTDYSHHFSDVKKMLQKVYDYNIHQLLDKLKQRSNYGKIFILGNQGTGKTHGIANVIETQLEKYYHIPVLIQAKSVSPQDEWKDILIRVLGVSQEWSEEELWTALESLSYRNEINYSISDIKDKCIRIVPKIVICIDGIDEIKPYTRWNERINQVKAIISRHSRIRFCFTGRPYAFDKHDLRTEKDYLKVVLSDDGDVPVKRLYDKYIKHYDVDDSEAKWLRYSLSTPYALKLVCELYERKSIGKIGKSDITVSNLLRVKFDKLNQEFKTQAGYEENVNDQIVKIVLLKINEIFEKQNEVTRTQVKVTLRELEIYHYLNESGIEKILDFLEKHSFLQSYQKCAKSFFEENETIYMLGTQPVYDYLKALRLFEKHDYSDELKLDNQVLENRGALQLYSVMVMEHYQKILWENESCRNYLEESDLFDVVAYSLVNVSMNISRKYTEWISEVMGDNAYALSLIVNKIVLPLARTKQHPLGSILLDKYLMKFDKPAERDIIWSIPSNLDGNDDSNWIRYRDIEYSNETYKLEEMDEFDGMPLVWAWGLSSVDNQQRTMIRQEIVKWGIKKPEEFYKLFQHFAGVNDAQVQMDIFAIAMSVTYVCRKNRPYLKMISRWIYSNIFQYKKIVKIRNAAIRYYSRAIMECAFSEKLLTDIQINKCRPPYRTESSLMNFAPEATEGTRMGGYKMLDYDLAKYVLCNPLDRLFLTNKQYQKEIGKMIKKYSTRYKLPELTSEKFVLGSAFGYIKNAGWREDVFYGRPNGGKPGERIGLDIAISRGYRPAAQGSMSCVMTITEKYTWCAKMELLGYLADRFPYYGYSADANYVDDYGMLEDYINPYQELCQIDIEKVMKETECILPEELAPTISECTYSKEGICKWLLESPLPDFGKWINIKEGHIALFAYHCISNEEQGVNVGMWLSSGLIKKGSVRKLTKFLKDKEFARQFDNDSGMFAYPETDCYISPLEVCWYDWKAEYESKILYGKNTLYKNVAKCSCIVQEHGEIYYEIPSKMVRMILGISSGEGYHYFNSTGDEIAYYMDAGERYGDSQHILLVKEEVFNTKIEEHGLQPVWIIRVLKRPSAKAQEKYNFFKDRDETYLVWKSNKTWQFRKIECDN